MRDVECLGQLRVSGPREEEIRAGTGHGEIGGRHRTGEGSREKGEPCPMRAFILSKESSLTRAQQEAAGTCLITRHSATETCYFS